ncbi:MAG: hypothetical protein EXR51_01960 [Dehalococcoidia bacterium]|nr:hypothetical protein [Dehalococcoidia bacterium]
MAETKGYDLTGKGGIQAWSSLPEGTKLTLLNGAVGEIIANPHDGGWVLIKFQEHPHDPSKVGQEEYVFFNEVQTAAG